MPPPDVLELIDRVVEMRQADAAKLAHLLGGEPKADAQQSNPYYAIWKVSGSAPVRTAELRLPKEAGSPRVIVIDLDTHGACASRAQVVRKYGEPPELSVPTPRQPPGSPTYYVYRQPWGDLRVGIDARDCVASVVIDAER